MGPLTKDSMPLDSFAEHYTMQVERDLHQAVAMDLSLTSAVPLTKTEERAVSDSGDNVEFFS